MHRWNLALCLLLTACGGAAPRPVAQVESERAAVAETEENAEAEPEPPPEPPPPAFQPDLAARTLESPPFEYYEAPGTRSFMWADLRRVRLAASDEIVAGVTDALRGLHADLQQIWDEPRTSPEHIERFAITSMGARNRWVATIVYDAPIRSAFEAVTGASEAVGGAPQPTPVGPDLLALRVAPDVLVLGTSRDLVGALARPVRTTPPRLAAEGHLYVWTMTNARRWLATRPREANPVELDMVLTLDPDRRFTVEALGPFEDELAAANAETVWRNRLTALGDNPFVRALALAELLSSATVDRRDPRTLRVQLRANATEITALARLFAMATAL